MLYSQYAIGEKESGIPTAQKCGDRYIPTLLTIYGTDSYNDLTV